MLRRSLGSNPRQTSNRRTKRPRRRLLREWTSLARRLAVSLMAGSLLLADLLVKLTVRLEQVGAPATTKLHKAQ